jgi:hypothetical protein
MTPFASKAPTKPARQAWFETYPFLICPIGNNDGATGLNIAIVQGAQNFKTGENAENAIKTPPMRLSVQVAAHKNAGRVADPARPGGKHVAIFINGNGTAGIPAPTRKYITRLTVLLGQRKTTAAIAFDTANLRHLHQA